MKGHTKGTLASSLVVGLNLVKNSSYHNLMSGC